MVDITTEIPLGTQVIKFAASVKPEGYYTDVYIESVSVYTIDNYAKKKASKTFQMLPQCKSWEHDILTTELNEVIASNMFVIEVKCVGNPSPSTPCGMDINPVVTAVFDRCRFYSDLMNMIHTLDSECSIPKEFIDTLLEYKALKLSIESGNIDKAIALYKKFVKEYTTVKHGCGCNK